MGVLVRAVYDSSILIIPPVVEWEQYPRSRA